MIRPGKSTERQPSGSDKEGKCVSGLKESVAQTELAPWPRATFIRMRLRTVSAIQGRDPASDPSMYVCVLK